VFAGVGVGRRSTRLRLVWGVCSTLEARCARDGFRRYKHMFYTTGMCDGESKADGSLDGLMGAIDAFLGGPPAEITPYELGAHLIRLRHGLDLLELRFARDAALFASTDESESQGSTSPVDWVRYQCAMSGNAAARAIATGEQAAAASGRAASVPPPGPPPTTWCTGATAAAPISRTSSIGNTTSPESPG
jgi:hypothetical protein